MKQSAQLVIKLYQLHLSGFTSLQCICQIFLHRTNTIGNMIIKLPQWKVSMTQSRYDSKSLWLKVLMTQSPYDSKSLWLKVLMTQSPYDSKSLRLKVLMTQSPYDSKSLWLKVLMTQSPYDSKSLWLRVLMTQSPSDSISLPDLFSRFPGLPWQCFNVPMSSIKFYPCTKMLWEYSKTIR